LKLAGGTKRQALLFGALGIVLLLALVRWRPGHDSAPAPAGASATARPSTAPPAAATDPEAAEALRQTASELETLLSILYDEQRKAAKEGGEG